MSNMGVELTADYLPPSDFLAPNSGPAGRESSSQASSGIYETVESNGSAQLEPSDLSTTDNAIYATPIKKDKSFSNLPAVLLVAAGDFDIQVDTRRDSELRKESAYHTTFRGSLFVNKAAADVINSDDEDSQSSRHIELSPEDVIVHSPPDELNSPNHLSPPDNPRWAYRITQLCYKWLAIIKWCHISRWSAAAHISFIFMKKVSHWKTMTARQ